MEYIKSPLNYTGGKFKLLPQLLGIFPENIDTFVDLFAGGGNVSVNVKANHVVYNDILWQVPKLLEAITWLELEDVLEQIDLHIKEFSLTKDNRDGYLQLRDKYNALEDKHTGSASILLYTLICFSFNNQIRFNSSGSYNMPFGKDRSSFNPALREKFKAFANRLQHMSIEFYSKDFREIKVEELGAKDLVYCDPPYLITVASYNENGGWGEKEEKALLCLLDKVNEVGSRFALSNVLESKGKSNDILKEWAKKYTVHYLTTNYSNCSYHKKDKTSKDIEVLIANY